MFRVDSESDAEDYAVKCCAFLAAGARKERMRVKIDGGGARGGKAGGRWAREKLGERVSLQQKYINGEGDKDRSREIQ